MCKRRMPLSDDELQELGLISLTAEHYSTLQQELVARLRCINSLYAELHSHVPTPTCPGLRKLFLPRSAPAVLPIGDISANALYELYIDFAHLVAAAKSRCVSQSAIGAMVQRRLATDLKISKHRLLLSLVEDPHQSSRSGKHPNNPTGLSKSVRYENATSSKIIASAALHGEERAHAVYTLELQFLYGKYCSIFKDEGVDLADLDLIAREFALHIPEADKHALAALLDPEMTGFVYFAYFLRWMQSPAPGEFTSVTLRTKQTVARVLQAATRTKYFAHAGDVLHARQRAVGRMEVAVREGILFEEGFAWEQSLQTLLEFYRSCEGGRVAEAVNARKYHILSASDSAKLGSVDRYGFDDASIEDAAEGVDGAGAAVRNNSGGLHARASRESDVTPMSQQLEGAHIPVRGVLSTRVSQESDGAGQLHDHNSGMHTPQRGAWSARASKESDIAPLPQQDTTEELIQDPQSAKLVPHSTAKILSRPSSTQSNRAALEQSTAAPAAGVMNSSGPTTPTRQFSQPRLAKAPSASGVAMSTHAETPSSAQEDAVVTTAGVNTDTTAVVTSSSPVPSRPPSARPSSASATGAAAVSNNGSPQLSPQPSPTRRTSSRPTSHRRRSKHTTVDANADSDLEGEQTVPLTPAERAASAAGAITASIQAAQRFSVLPNEIPVENDENVEETNDAVINPAVNVVEKPTIRGRVYDNLVKLYTLKWREEESEHRVIYRVVEQRAAWQYWRGLFTSLGRYNLVTERQLMTQLDTMIDAVGYCLPHTAAITQSQETQPTIQQVLTAHFGSSVSSLASGSLHNINTADTYTVSVKAPVYSPQPSPGNWHVGRYDGGLNTNGSLSSHTHSYALLEGPDDGSDFEADEHPFGYLDPATDAQPSSVASVSQRAQVQVDGRVLTSPSGKAGVNPGPAQGMSGSPSNKRGHTTSVRFQDIPQLEDVDSAQDLPLQPPHSDPQQELWEQERQFEAQRDHADTTRLLLTALEMAISVYDTDCTGDLDEGEVRLLLTCLRCSLSEKAFRHAFADHDDVIRGVSVHELVAHLSDRVRFTYGSRVAALLFGQALSLTQAGRVRRAAGVLVTLQRQLAHKRALQTVKMSKMGRIVMLRESHSGTSDQTLLVRTQLFAMRQVHAFVRTTQGRIKLHHTLQDVSFSYLREVVSHLQDQTPIAVSGVCYLNYAYSVHHEGDGILVTELPHVVKFLVRECHLQPSTQLTGLGQVFCDLRGSADVRTLSHAEFSAVCTPLFHPPSRVQRDSFWTRLGLSRRLRRHAKLRMQSCARQQAVKIAMEFPVIDVAETNYRCSVLGLRRFIDTNLSTLQAAAQRAVSLPPPVVSELPVPSAVVGGTADAVESDALAASGAEVGVTAQGADSNNAAVPAQPEQALEEATSAERGVTKRGFSLLPFSQPARSAVAKTDVYVPTEAVSLYLLSLGYSLRDLSHDSLQGLCDVDHLQGHFELNAVGLNTVKDTARTHIAKPGTYLESFRRARRKLTHGTRYRAEFKVTVQALVQYSAIVDKKGGEFLKELLVGVSHCLK
jgi:hypothetical protein